MVIKNFGASVAIMLALSACSTGFLNSSPPDQALNAVSANADARKGASYLFGRGIPQDSQKAFYYFNKAAQAGDVYAQNEVAYLYAAGKGTPRNPAKALYWYQKAAQQGIASAQYNVGLMYYYGMGIPANQELGMRWIQKAAARHFAPAQTFIATKVQARA